MMPVETRIDWSSLLSRVAAEVHDCLCTQGCVEGVRLALAEPGIRQFAANFVQKEGGSAADTLFVTYLACRCVQGRVACMHCYQ